MSRKPHNTQDVLRRLKRGSITKEEAAKLGLLGNVPVIGSQQRSFDLYKQLMTTAQHAARELRGDLGPPIPRGFRYPLPDGRVWIWGPSS